MGVLSVARTVAAKELRTLFGTWRFVVPVLLGSFAISLGILLFANYMLDQAQGPQSLVVGTDSGQSASALAAALPSDWKVLVVDDEEGALRSGTIDAYVAPGPEGGAPSVTFASSSTSSAAAASTLSQALGQPSAGSAVSVRDIDDGHGTKVTYASSYASAVISLCISSIPLTFVATVTVREKERSTLEPLLSCGASPLGIALGKYGAILTCSVVGLASSLAGVAAFDAVTQGALHLEWVSIASVAGAAIVGAVAFSALSLALGQGARTLRSCQFALTLISIAAMIPLYATMGLVLGREPLWYWAVPSLDWYCLLLHGFKGVPVPDAAWPLTVAVSAALTLASLAAATLSLTRWDGGTAHGAQRT